LVRVPRNQTWLGSWAEAVAVIDVRFCHAARGQARSGRLEGGMIVGGLKGPGFDGFLGVPTGGVGVDAPGTRSGPDGYRFAEGRAAVMQPHPVLGGIAGVDLAGSDQLPVRAPSGLVGEVIVDAVAEGQESQAIGERPEAVTERVRGATGVPAEAARADPRQDDPLFPASFSRLGRPCTAQTARRFATLPPSTKRDSSPFRG